jgi:hypothetical protein
LTRRLSDRLGDRLRGAWLVGSAAVAWARGRVADEEDVPAAAEAVLVAALADATSADDPAPPGAA